MTATTIDRTSATRRPRQPAAGYHRWRDLSFLHWRVPAETLRPLLPERLAVDTWDGSAWVGLVPFRMEGVRPWWSPPVPGLSAFPETNVRTYVHRDGRDPGVWFFSLDAANSPAVRLARWGWHLNYFRSRMSVARGERGVEYRSRRLWPEPAEADCNATVDFGEPLGSAATDTLEHFLVERYLLYTSDDSGRLYRGQVHHHAYPLRRASCVDCEETLSRAAGIDLGGRSPEHVLFSDGVDVEVFRLERV